MTRDAPQEAGPPRPREMPDVIYAWPSDVTPAGETALAGSWGARRHYTDEAVRYIRAEPE